MLVGALLLLAGFFVLNSPPIRYDKETVVQIAEGSTLQDIAELLYARGIIRSPLLFQLIVQHEGKERGVVSGAYLFDSPQTLLTVARRMAHGERGIETLRVTFPEGITIRKMGDILSATMPMFNRDAFLLEAEGKEGYLFPDTYFFFSTATSEEIVRTMEDNFLGRTEALEKEAKKLGLSWPDVVTMASLLEGEAGSATDRRIISGILWKRIKIHMRLQVDAPFVYLLGKGSSELSLDDLQWKSPYNTYQNYGLPPGPIGNPGLDAIDSAIHPTASEYLYYLSDDEGVMHYARTFEEHKRNKERYLR